jgi:hypothetical protein
MNLSTPENVELLQAAVEAKVAYWDAICNLEHALKVDDDLSDRASDAIHEWIESAAVSGGNDITMDDLKSVIELSEVE